MKRGYLLLRRLSKIFLFGIIFNFATAANAYFPLNWDDLMFQMEKRMSWRQVRMQTVVQVFDAFAKNADGDFSERPVELPARGFKQVIHWKDGEVLIVETQDDAGQLLHYYYEYNQDLLAVSLNKNRTFETADILPRQLRIRSRYGNKRRRALKEVGIISQELAYHLRADNHVFLRLGDLESGHYALLNPKTFDLVSLHNRLWLAGGTWLETKIVFKNYTTYRWQTYPIITEYFLDGRLFKRTTVKKIRTLSRLPMKKLQEQAWKLRNLENATLQNNYAL